MSQFPYKPAIVLGRFMLASLFLLGGLNKIVNFETVATNMESVGLAPAELLLPLTIVLELVGGLIVATGFRYITYAACLLALFTLVANVFFHNFWAFEGQRQTLELALFFKNVSIAGALLTVAGWYAKDKS